MNKLYNVFCCISNFLSFSYNWLKCNNSRLEEGEHSIHEEEKVFPTSNHEEENVILEEVSQNHPNPELGHSIHEEEDTPQPSNQQEHHTMVGVISPVDSGDMVSGIASRIGASHDEVRCKILKTIEAHQHQKCPSLICQQ